MIRYARWVAVSSRKQAEEDKASIPHQLEATLKAGQEKGWVEACGPFVAPGYSRSKEIYLPDAERKVPPLHELMDAVRHRRLDVIIMTEADRLRGLLDQVRETCARYGVQLYSLAQPSEIFPPEQFDQYAADAQMMTFGLSQIISRADISRTRRKWRGSMPSRGTVKGLAYAVPWGYRKPPGREDSHNAVLEIDPAAARHLLHIRDMLLAGQSLRQLVAYLNEHQVPPPRGKRWYPGTVRLMLLNDFYCGWVSWGATRRTVDPEGRHVRAPVAASSVTRARGKHPVLWDDATHERIAAELHRRRRNYTGGRTRRFTALLRCGTCGASMWLRKTGDKSHAEIWRCSKVWGHPPILHAALIPKLAEALARELKPRKPREEAQGPDARAALEAAGREAERQLERLEAAYLQQQFSLERYSLHKSRLDAELADIRAQLDALAAAAESREMLRRSAREVLDVGDLREWLAEEEPQIVNHRLRLIVRSITVTNGEAVTIQLRA